MAKSIIVFSTASSKEEAERIAGNLVENRIAACVNIITGVLSVYRWKGKVEKSGEVLLIIKTMENKFPLIKERIKSLHSYDVPEIIALDIAGGAEDYLSWIAESTI